MAHGFLSYQDTRGEVDWLGKTFNAIKDYIENRERKEKVADMVAAKVSVLNDQKALPQGQTPLLKGGDQKQLAATPLQKMIGGTALQRSLPAGPAAVNPEVVGGGLARGGFNGKPLRPEGFASNAIVDIGATNLGVERDIGGTDMFVKTLSDVSGDSGAVVQAIDRLTMVTMSLVDATKQQTSSQQQIAAAQQQQSEKLGRKSLAAAEEASLEGGGDFSSNAGYLALASQGMGMMRGGGGRGGGPGMGIGGKVMTKNILKAATKRGAARTGTRLGAAVGGKLLGGFGKKAGAKLGGKAIGKVAGGAIAKSLGKKIPLVGLGLGAVFAAQRAMQGDFLGAGLELASGAASTVPGLGTAGSVGIDAALAARDMTMMADGGIVDSATNAIIGEDGKEGVFPLEGARGKKTFIQFGEGILDAQKRNKRDFAKIQAEGLKEYYDKGRGWKGIFEGIKEILSGFKVPGLGKIFDFDGDDDDDDDDDGGGGDGDRTVDKILRNNYKFGHNLPSTGTGDASLAAAQQYGASRDGGKRKHAGQDFDIAGDKDTFESQIGGEVIGIYNDPGGYGRYVDIYNKDLNVTERIAEGAEILVKKGDNVKPGTPVARGETNTGVIHYEIRKGKSGPEGDFAGTVDPMKFLREHTEHIDGVPKNDVTKITPDQVTPLKNGLKLEQITDSEGSRDEKVEQLEKLKKLLGMGQGPEGSFFKQLTGLKGLSQSEGRNIKDEEMMRVPGVGTIGYFNNGFVKKYTFFNENGDEIKQEEFNKLLQSERKEVREAEELLNRSSDAGGADELNASSSEVLLSSNTPLNNTTIINNNGGNNGGGSSTIGNQVPIGSSSDDMGAGVYSNAHIRTLNC